MAGPSRWKGNIALGPLLQLPVIARSAVREEKFPFNQHHAEDGGRVRMPMPVCERCGNDVPKEQIVRGYEGKAGVDDGYLDSLALEKSSIMQLDGLVPASQIDARYYQKSYTLEPDEGGAKGYVLLLRLLERAKRVGVGKVVAGGKEFIVTVRPKEGVLSMELMYWPAELQADVEARTKIEGVTVSAAELKMGDQLVAFLSKEFDPEQYVNGYAVALREYLEAFLADEAPAQLPTARVAKPTMDLEGALAMSLAALQGTAAEKVAVKKGRAKKEAA